MADLDFQPLDFVPDSGIQPEPDMGEDRVPPSPGMGGTQAPSAQPASNPPASPSLDFRPLDFVPEPGRQAEGAESAAPSKLPSEPGEVAEEELSSVAQKHKIDPEELRHVAPYYGIDLKPRSAGEMVSQAGKQTAGAAGEMALGIPQYLYKKTQSEDFQKALDDLHELSQSKKSIGQKALEFGRQIVVPLPGIGAESMAGRLGSAVGIGAVAGAANAPTGQELRGAGYGAAGGALLGAGAEAIPAVAGLLGRKLSPAELEKGGVNLEAPRSREMDLETGKNQIAERTQESEKIIQDAIQNRELRLTPQQAEVVIRDHGDPEGIQQIQEMLEADRNRAPTSHNSEISSGERELANLTSESESLEQKLREAQSQGNTDEISNLRNQASDLDRQKESLTDSIHQIESQEPELTAGREPLPVSEEAIKQNIAQGILENRAKDYAEALTGNRPSSIEKAFSAIEHEQRQGPEFAQQTYNEMLARQQRNRFREEAGLFTNSPTGMTGKGINFVSAGKYVARHIEDKTGLPVEQAFQELQGRVNRQTYAQDKLRTSANELALQARKEAGLTNDSPEQDWMNLGKAIESGDLSGLSPAQQKYATGVRGYFNEARDFANGGVRNLDKDIKPMAIPEEPNYLPRMLKKPDELLPIAEQKIREAQELASEQLGRPVNSLAELNPAEYKALQTEPQFQDLENLINLGTSAKATFRTGPQLQEALNKKLYNQQGISDLIASANALIERKEGAQIPDWAREWNVNDLMDRWGLNTISTLYRREPIQKLQSLTSSLEKAGYNAEAGWVRTLAQDALGVRKGTLAEASTRYQVSIERALDRAIRDYGSYSPTAMSLRAIKGISSALEYGFSNIHGNIMGWNAHSVYMHVGAALGRIPQELGTYGYKILPEALGRTVTNYRASFARAQQLGNIPEKFIRGAELGLKEGLAATLPAHYGNQAVQAINRAGMAAFQMGEHVNRALAVNFADTMAADLAAKNPAAWSATNKLPLWMRQKLVGLSGDKQAMSDVLARYINDTTIFNYNRTAMSQFGRTLGKWFTTFSTWPTSIAGEAMYELRNKGLIAGMQRTAERLAVPALILNAVNKQVFPSGEMSDRVKKVTGSKGLASPMPIGSLNEFAEGKLFTPPAVSMAQGFVQPLIKGEPDKMKSGVSNIMSSMVPGAGFTRFLTDDLVTAITGKRPEGHNFLERTQSGIKKITGR